MFSKRTWAEINLSAATHNFNEIQRYTGSEIIAVVKANAYGHGAVRLAELYESLGAKYLAVACLDEAVQLREAKIECPILILGMTPPQNLPYALKLGLTQSVFSVHYAHEVRKFAPDMKVHIKVDTGMGRLGVKTVKEVCEIARMLPCEGIFMHFADADNPDLTFTEEQMNRFEKILEETRKEGFTFKICHCANSAAVLHYKRSHLTYVRPGLILYGLYPEARRVWGIDLIPVMKLNCAIADIRTIRAGESVSYGRSFLAERDMRVAVLPCGYADGLSRRLSNSGEVFLRGMRVPIIGRICMDMCMIDVSNVPNVKIGDVVQIFGSDLPVDEMAARLGTISYEICSLITKRVPRVILSASDVPGNLSNDIE